MPKERRTNLYHCTKGESLVNILQSKHFRYSYCLEKYDGLKSGFGNDTLAYALVCFADLYSSELRLHMKQFKADAYIMMTKEWAMKNRVSPVIYYYQNGISNVAFLNVAKCAVNYYYNNQNGSEEKLFKAVELLRPFFKKYEGCYFIKETRQFSSEKVEFFLEREWRSFPIVENNERYYLSEQDYLVSPQKVSI